MCLQRANQRAALLSLVSLCLLPRSAPRPLPPPMLLRISTLGSFRRVVHPFFAVFLSSPCPLNLSAVLLWTVFSPAAAGVGPRLQLPAAVSEFVGASCQVEGETLSGARIAPLPLLPGMFLRSPAFSTHPLPACPY